MTPATHQAAPSKPRSLKRPAAPAHNEPTSVDLALNALIASIPPDRLAESALDYLLGRFGGALGTITYVDEIAPGDGSPVFTEIWLKRQSTCEREHQTHASKLNGAGGVDLAHVRDHSASILRAACADMTFVGRDVGAIRVVPASGVLDSLRIDELKRACDTLAPVLWALAVERTNVRCAAELARAKAETRSLLDGSVDAIVAVQVNGRIETVNPAASRMFGYSREELIGRKLKTLLPNVSREQQEEYRWRCIETGQTSVFYAGREELARRKDGSTFPIEISVGVTNQDGQEIFLGIMRDITERKQAEAAAQKHAEELARSNRELDDFAYIASHDLKAPLRGIHNYAGFLTEDYADKLDADGKEKLATLGRLARRMEDIINDLLTYSRVGRTELSIAEVDLNAVLADVIDSLGVFMQEANARVHLAAPLPTLRCDQVRIRAVFHNLITNGIKYNDSAEKRIDISWQAAEADGEREIVITVADNGIGIPTKHQDKIFGIFKRLHTGDKYGGGTGAGLAIVKKIVDQHAGRIWLDSEPGRGTAFHVALIDQQAQGNRP